MRNTVCCLFLLIFSTNTFSVNSNLILADSFPDKLSEFEFFVDDSAQEPHEKVIPYELISTLFSDYSYKQRWVYVPNNAKASYVKDWVFDFPEGSALIKTFYYPVDERNPDLGKQLLETRLLLRKKMAGKRFLTLGTNNKMKPIKKLLEKPLMHHGLISWETKDRCDIESQM